MSGPFAVATHAFGFCDRCGFRYPLTVLRAEVVDFVTTSTRVCPTCWDPDQPQNHLGDVNVVDPQALRNPRPDLAQSASRFGDAIRWDFIESADYWFGKEYGTGSDPTVTWESSTETITFVTLGDNPALVLSASLAGSQDASIDTDIYLYLRMRLKMNVRPTPVSTMSGVMKFLWNRTTDTPGSFSDDRSVVIAMPDWNTMGDPWHKLTWDVSGHAEWTGTVNALRFDLFDFTGLSSYTGVTLELDYIRAQSAGNPDLIPVPI